MTNPAIEQAIAARDAAKSRFDNLEPDVPRAIYRAVCHECQAAKERVEGLLEEERREQGIEPRPADDTVVIVSIGGPEQTREQRGLLARAVLQSIGAGLDASERERLAVFVAEAHTNPE